MKKSQLIKIIKEEITRVLEGPGDLRNRAAAAMADMDSMDFDDFGSDDGATTAPPSSATEPKPETKCQGAKYTKECAIAFLKEFLPLLKGRGRNALEARSDCQHRHRVKQLKKVAKGYRVNGIIVMDTEIR